jgi:protein SCO1/2
MDYMASEYKRLARPEAVAPVFVSVDPNRDDAKALKTYTAYYGPEFIGVSGDKATLDAMTHAVGAGYVIEPPQKPNGDYNVSHTNLIFVLDPDGRLVAGYVPDSQPGQMAKDFDGPTRP